jgi:thiamine kinase-like enzyme
VKTILARRMLHSAPCFILSDVCRVDAYLQSAQQSNINLLTQLSILQKEVAKRYPEVHLCRKRYALIHRDIRPSNILYKDKRFSFIDFDFVQNDDLYFELGSSSFLLAKNDANLRQNMLDQFNDFFQVDRTTLLLHTLKYYLDSSFPLKHVSRLKPMVIEQMALDRINLLRSIQSQLQQEV